MSKNGRKNLILMAAGVFGMGVFLSLLLKAGYGTDTSSFMNSSIASRLDLPLGPVMICMNGLLFIVHFIREHRLTGICTIDDMIPLYRPLFIMPFFPISIFISQIENITSFVIAMTGFVISPALSMDSESGLAPYDAIPVMLSNALHIPSMQYVFPQSRQEL